MHVLYTVASLQYLNVMIGIPQPGKNVVLIPRSVWYHIVMGELSGFALSTPIY